MHRFVNTDYGSFAIIQSLAENSFTYCKNSPTIFIDPNGTTAYSLPIPYNPPITKTIIQSGASGFALKLSPKLLSFLSVFFLVLLYPAPTASDDTIPLDSFIVNSAAYANLISTLTQAKEKAAANTTTPKTPTNEHHIVPKKARGAERARNILESLGISVYTDPDNLVTVSTTMHWYMHTDIYCIAVNSLIELVYEYSDENKEYNVRWMLKTIKAVIQMIDSGSSLILQ